MPLLDDWLWDDDFTLDDWHESIFDVRTVTVSRDRSLGTVSIVTDFAKWRAALRFALGYSYVDDRRNLRRLTPIWHPEITWLYATQLSRSVFHGPQGPVESTEWPGTPPLGVYAHATLEFTFEPPPYLPLEDDDVDDETGRYVVYLSDPYGELVEMPAGAMKYVNPTAGAPPAGKNHAPVSINRLYTTLQKGRFAIRWHEVPLDFFQDPDGKRPTFKNAQKTVNEVEIFGRPAGTLLCETIQTSEPKPMPVASEERGELVLACDVTVNWVEFDPPRGDAAVNKFGHNLAPAAVTGLNGDRCLGWLYATHDGTEGGKPQFASYDHLKIFKHYSFA